MVISCFAFGCPNSQGKSNEDVNKKIFFHRSSSIGKEEVIQIFTKKLVRSTVFLLD